MKSYGHKHYVPIVKTKAGELWALSELKAESRPHVTPLFEIHDHENKTIAHHTKKLAKDLADKWGQDEFFADTCWLHSDQGHPPFATSVFKNFRDAGLQAIPVVRLTYSTSMLDAIKQILVTDQRGYLLRLLATEVGSPRVAALIHHMGTQLSEVDLLVDFRGSKMDLQSIIPTAVQLGDWRNLTAASGVFPASLNGKPLSQWFSVSRECWASWKSGVQSHLARKPAFGDYCIRSPGRPATGGAPRTNVRYCTEDEWKIQQRGRLKDKKAAEIHDICADLVSQSFYSQPPFSVGDRVFNEVAVHAASRGNATSWVQWSSNHHIEFVVHQLRNDPSI